MSGNGNCGFEFLVLGFCSTENRQPKTDNPKSKSNILGAMIQTVTVFDTRRGIVMRDVMRAAKRRRTKTGVNALIPAVTHGVGGDSRPRNSAVQELLSGGWGSA